MGAPYRFAYFPTTRPEASLPDRGGYYHFGGLGKLEVTTGETHAWHADGAAIVSPPSFAPRPGGTAEDDGWLLSYVLRESGAEVVVLDAQKIAAGPVATLGLGMHLPGVSHVRWAPDVKLDG